MLYTPTILNNDIPFITKIIVEYKIDAIIPLLDIDVLKLAENREIIESYGAMIIGPCKDTALICNDKYSTYEFLNREGFNTIPTFLSTEQVILEIERKKIQYPLVVKPRWGMGSIGVYTAENVQELVVLYNKVRRDIYRSQLKYESSRDENNCVIIQPKIVGTEYGCDIINDLNGNYCTSVVKMKLSMRAGETDRAIVVDNPSIEKEAKRISKLLKHKGNMDVDIMEKDGEYYILELNARFGGGYPFSHISGVNLPQAIVEWLEGKETDYSRLQAEIGVMGQKSINISNIVQ